MPFLTVPLIAAIASLAGTGVTLGESLANQPSAPKMPAVPPTTPLTPSQNLQQQQAAGQSFANQQAQGGGAFSPEYLFSMAGGQNPQSAGNVQAALNQFTGLTSPGQTGLTPGTAGTGGMNILDLLTQSSRGAGSPLAGIAGTETGGDLFKGLTS